MKTVLKLLLSFCLFHSTGIAQTVFGPPHFNFIDLHEKVVAPMIPSDIDNDGDLDIVFRASLATYGWYENLDGMGHFGNTFHIIGEIDNANSKKMRLADLDNDGDTDVIASLWFTNELIWFENEDGLGHFSEKQVIEDNLPFSDILEVGDINADNVLDIITSRNDTINLVTRT